MERQRPNDTDVDHAPEPAEPAGVLKAQGSRASVQLQAADLVEFRQIQSWFPPGTVSISRLARLAIHYGMPALMEKFSQAAERLKEPR